MTINSIKVVYFSATYTTQKIVRAIAQAFGLPFSEYDITCESDNYEPIFVDPEQLLITGMPVYAGRIPAHGAEMLKLVKGNNSPAIAICVYGNRDYDDALLELSDITEQQGFRVIAAAAFIAQHSIFPKMAESRPDENDMIKISAFVKRCTETIDAINEISSMPTLEVKGKRPYKPIKSIPLTPKGSKRGCNNCGKCAALCPTNAIDKNCPSQTDKKKCISCGRCVVVCPQGIRHFGGLLYAMAGKKLIAENNRRKEPDWFLQG